MWRSNRPPSGIDASPSPSNTPPRRSLRRTRVWRIAASLARWLHIYTSMIGLAAALFFGATGLTLNHPDWFANLARSKQDGGSIERAWLDPQKPEKLRIVEHLRLTHHLRGSIDDFSIEDPETTLLFKGPGYSASVFIDSQSGRYQITEEHKGLVAVLNDLHKGRDSGRVWAWVVDASAVVLVVISATGLVLLYTLKLRRVSGTLVAIVGTLVLVLLALYGVP